MNPEQATQADAGQPEVDLVQALTRSIEQNPLAALGIAAGVGFVVGGGLRTRLGFAAMLYAGRMVAKEVFVSALTASFYGHGRPNLKTSGGTRGSRDRSPAEPVRGQSEGRGGGTSPTG